MTNQSIYCFTPKVDLANMLLEQQAFFVMRGIRYE